MSIRKVVLFSWAEAEPGKDSYIFAWNLATPSGNRIAVFTDSLARLSFSTADGLLSTIYYLLSADIVPRHFRYRFDVNASKHPSDISPCLLLLLWYLLLTTLLHECMTCIFVETSNILYRFFVSVNIWFFVFKCVIRALITFVFHEYFLFIVIFFLIVKIKFKRVF